MSNEFPTFREWLASDAARKESYENDAIRKAGYFIIVPEVSSIIRGHADFIVNDFDNDLEPTLRPEDITERVAEDFSDTYEYDTFDGPTRMTLILWAWNSNLNITEHGPIVGDNPWDQVERVTWDEVNRVARMIFLEFVRKYIEARDGQED